MVAISTHQYLIHLINNSHLCAWKLIINEVFIFFSSFDFIWTHSFFLHFPSFFVVVFMFYFIFKSTRQFNWQIATEVTININHIGHSAIFNSVGSSTFAEWIIVSELMNRSRVKLFLQIYCFMSFKMPATNWIV